MTTPRRRVRGLVAAVALVLATGVAGLASSGTANAADPIVVGSCATTVQGAPGTPLALSPAAVLAPVLNVVRAVPVLGPTLVGGVQSAVSNIGNIPLGSLPGSDTTVSGAQISGAALPRIQEAIKNVPLIGGVLAGILGGVQNALTTGCGIVVDVVNAAGAPVQDTTEALADASEQATGRLLPGGPGPGQPAPDNPGQPSPGSPGGMPTPNQPPLGGGFPGGGLQLYEPGLWNFGRSPMADYTSIPFARPGLFAPSPAVRYGGGVPGYSPEFGILGNDTPQDDGVQVAGRAEAVSPPEGQKIAFPVLLAVLALSCVTAALVRTWVLRKAAPAAL